MVQEQAYHWTTSSPPFPASSHVCSCSSSKTSGPFPSLALPGLLFVHKRLYHPLAAQAKAPGGIFKSLAPLVHAPPQLCPQNRWAHPLWSLWTSVLGPPLFLRSLLLLFSIRNSQGSFGKSDVWDEWGKVHTYPVTLMSRGETYLSPDPHFAYRPGNQLYLLLILRLMKWFFRQTLASVSSSLSTEACSPVLGSLCPASPFLGLWMSFGP